MSDLNRLERIILNDNSCLNDNLMLLDFQLASVKTLHCSNYDELDILKFDLMQAYKLDEVQYDRYLHTATEYNFWRNCK